MATKLFLSHAHDEAELALKFADWLEATFSRSVEVICTSRPSDRIKFGEMVTTASWSISNTRKRCCRC
jgi:hypothetical protein